MAARDRAPQWYNTAENFRLATTRVLDIKGELEYQQYMNELVKGDSSPTKLKYGDVRDFYLGLSTVLGEERVAQADVQAAMEAEHCRSADGQTPLVFTSGPFLSVLYLATTCGRPLFMSMWVAQFTTGSYFSATSSSPLTRSIV